MFRNYIENTHFVITSLPRRASGRAKLSARLLAALDRLGESGPAFGGTAFWRIPPF